MASQDSFGARSTLTVGDRSYELFRLDKVEGAADLPYSLKILLENLLRTEDGANITADHVRALAGWDPSAEPDTEIQFTPARVLMQDFTGVPCVVDLAAMREAMAALGGDPKKINPLAPAELVIDHSVVADFFGTKEALGLNGELEHGAIWHEAGGWAMRAKLPDAKSIVPAAKVVAAAGFRLQIPLHHIRAAYVRSHFNTMDVGVVDSPRPDELLYALVMSTGSRIHERLGGLRVEAISVNDGQR